MGEKKKQSVLDEALGRASHPAVDALIDSLPRKLHGVLDRMLYELPLSNPADNWLLRMAKLKGLNADQATAVIEAWQQEMDAKKTLTQLDFVRPGGLGRPA